MYTLPSTLAEDIKYLGTLIDEFTEGKLEPVKFKAIRVPMGIYEQRTDGTFMVRIRCAGGFITPKQLAEVARIASHHGSGQLNFTTRQEIQIQNLQLKETLSIIQNLREIGLTSKGGGGNTVRNIMASVNSGIEKNEVFDVLPYVFGLTTKLIAESDSFTLPRKLKIAFSNSDEDTSFAKFNDLGFIASVRDGKRGFKVYLGGSLATKPLVGYQIIDFAPEEDLFYIADAAKKLFSRYGNRKNKHKARLRYVFYKLGFEEVSRLFFEIYNEIKASEDIPYKHSGLSFEKYKPSQEPVIFDTEAFLLWKKRYAIEQSQNGLYSVIVPFKNGISGWKTIERIAQFAEGFGVDTLRFSMRKNLYFRNIPEAYLGNVYQLLKEEQLYIEQPLLLNTLVACTGADTCRLGICLSKGASNAIVKHLSKSNLDLDQLSGLRINLSGCPNSCGQHIAADLGFFGKVGRNDRMFPAYNVVAGAQVGNDAKLAGIIGEVSAYDLPRFTADILGDFISRKEQYNSFSSYIAGESDKAVAGILQKYAAIPDFADDKNYYFDWGSDNIFSLAAKGVGECSAGLFDMIEVDLEKINRIKTEIELTCNREKLNGLLYELVFASSRMLLITRGAEPKNNAEVFNAFIEKFIDSHIVSGIFREVVEYGRDNQHFDFTLKKETILELSQTVISLYENMDDSLQFKNVELKATEVPKQSTAGKRNKDFRGVACPMNFVKTKIELATLKSGDILEILLDDGDPIENVPGSIRGEGHTVLEESKIENYWKVVIQKA